MLLAAGADIAFKPDSRTESYRSYLGQAVYARKYELVPWLIEKGAQPDGDQSLLISTTASEDPAALSAAKCFLAAGVPISNDLLLCNAATPEMLRLLGEHGARTASLSSTGKSAFMRHAINRSERLRLMREYGCDLAAIDECGRSLLHSVVARFPDAMALPELWPVLKDIGIDVNAVDISGATALQLLLESVLPYAVGKVVTDDDYWLSVAEALELVEILLDAGADTHLRNAAGEDAIGIARRLKAPRNFLQRLKARH